MMALASAGPTAYWYLTRGTGTVALILLTVSVALGVANVKRLRTENLPRFVVDAVHRNVSLLAMAFLVVHIATSLLDGYAPIRILDVFVPFVSAYRPLWLGLGAVALDLLAAVLITSLLRRRFGYRAWRITHWAAYACWPVALLHGLGTGSDTKAGWMLALVAACVIVVVVAVVARATAGWPQHAPARLAALGVSALAPLGLLIWLPIGPLAAGWAKKAGTPAALLTTTVARRAPSAAPRAVGAFTASVSGSVQQSQLSDGLGRVDISLAISGQQLNQLAIHLTGQPLQSGGLALSSSSVTLGTESSPDIYSGRVTSLQATTVAASVSDAAGHTLKLVAQLQVPPGSDSVSGTVSASP